MVFIAKYTYIVIILHTFNYFQVLKINSNNKAATNFLSKTIQQIKLQRKKELATFKGMFDKFVKEDEVTETFPHIFIILFN